MRWFSVAFLANCAFIVTRAGFELKPCVMSPHAEPLQHGTILPLIKLHGSNGMNTKTLIGTKLDTHDPGNLNSTGKLKGEWL